MVPSVFKAKVNLSVLLLSVAVRSQSLPLECTDSKCVTLLEETHFEISCRSVNCFGCRWTAGGLAPVSKDDFITCELVDIQDVLLLPDLPYASFDLVDDATEEIVELGRPRRQDYDARGKRKQAGGWLDLISIGSSRQEGPARQRLQDGRGSSRGGQAKNKETETLFYKLASTSTDDTISRSSIPLPKWLTSIISAVASTETRGRLLDAADAILTSSTLESINSHFELLAKSAKYAALMEALKASRDPDDDFFDGHSDLLKPMSEIQTSES